jgi:membrane-bound inhibitor of C-type lysozyme
VTGYLTGQEFTFVASGANTGATTLNVNGLGAKNIYKSGTLPLELDDIVSGQAVTVYYDGTQFQISSGAGGSGAKANGVIYENNTTISADYTLTASKNGFSVGPITINSGAAVTVPSGQRWVVL